MPTANEIIVLVGLMGSGKTRIGSELAKLLKMAFIDADREIEQAAGCTISEIFEKFGEQEFRSGEKKVMLRLLSGPPIVLASGGGAFIQPELRSIIKQKAISVWLNADLDILVERTSRTSHRPLLLGGDPVARLRQMMEERYPIYAEADITIVSDQQTPQNTAWKIKTALENLLRKG